MDRIHRSTSNYSFVSTVDCLGIRCGFEWGVRLRKVVKITVAGSLVQTDYSDVNKAVNKQCKHRPGSEHVDMWKTAQIGAPRVSPCVPSPSAGCAFMFLYCWTRCGKRIMHYYRIANSSLFFFMCARWMVLKLTLIFMQYPAIHTNYIISHCTTLQYNHNIWHGT